MSAPPAVRWLAPTVAAGATVGALWWTLGGRPVSTPTALAVLGVPAALLLLSAALRRAAPATVGALLAGAFVVGLERDLTPRALVAGAALVVALQVSLLAVAPPTPGTVRARLARLAAVGVGAPATLVALDALVADAAPPPVVAVAALVVLAAAFSVLASTLRRGR